MPSGIEQVEETTVIGSIRIPFLSAWCLVVFQVPAAGAPGLPSRPGSYAVVVGSSHGGQGQEDLDFAHRDARTVGDVLTELGGYEEGKVTVLLDPKKEELLAALGGIGEKLEGHAGRGEQSVFVFYYSGHARAHALSMGEEELPLAVLRRRLVNLPSTVTIAVLDACQSGAISQIKGAEPAADFSYNSVNDLDTAGVAVMASSSGSELSQESEALGSSYFTHHLVVGLRGAADGDRDGRVTLSEAYRYAYNRTLVSTAGTAVGKQHVTLETALKGKGEMVLTYPAEASSALRIPEDLHGEILVHREPGRTVMAELSKAGGDPVSLAFPPGDYVALVRTDDKILRCELSLGAGVAELHIQGCEEAEPDEVNPKGDVLARPETWAVELGLGAFLGVTDRYNERLEDFRFQYRHEPASLLSISLAVSHSFSPYLSVLAGWNMLDRGRYDRDAFDLDGNRREQSFEWSAYGAGLYVRGTLPLWGGRIKPFIQSGGGLAWGSTVLEDPMDAAGMNDEETHWGYHLGFSGGVAFMPWRHFGFFTQAGYFKAPVVENLMGDVHDSGGVGVYAIGLRGVL